MMFERRVGLVDYGLGDSGRICALLAEKLAAADFLPVRDSVEGAELIVVIGGDGSFLRTLERFDFPSVPFVGVNTGHLGFFQELSEGDLDEFVYKYLHGDFRQQVYRTVAGSIECAGGTKVVRGLNELVVRAADSRLAHFDIFIGDNFIERFSGDGVVVSTPAGSTAYSYALGGSIVDPRLDLLQLTPIAPVNTTAYRSFTSGIVLPPGLAVSICPRPEDAAARGPGGGAFDLQGGDGRGVRVAIDGNEQVLDGVFRIEAGLSEQSVRLLRFKDYEFWNTVKQKLLTA